MPRRLVFLLKISFYEDKKIFSCSDLERYLGYKTGQPDVREILKLLEEKHILIFVDKLFGVKRYKLDRKMLRDYIDEIPAVNLLYDYFKIFHIVSW